MFYSQLLGNKNVFAYFYNSSDERTGDVFLFDGEETEISIYLNGEWRFET
ncbi:hypothetical protein [Microseira sp. BLCC-F43]